MPTCKHLHNDKTYFCHKISFQDVRRMNQKFHSEPDLQVQNNYILNFTTVGTPLRRRSNDHANKKNREISIKYFINNLSNGNIKKVQICKKAFCEILDVSRDRVQ